MSAFFIGINRSKKPFIHKTAQLMMNAIEHYGKDDQQLITKDNYAIGYQSFWTVPEELNEVQPLYDHSDDAWFVFVGRVDNRSELFELISETVDNAHDQTISDAKLVLMLYQQYGHSKIDEIIGPFAFVYFCPAKNQLYAARDAMGGRYLCYQCTSEHIFIATYELAICAHPAVSFILQENKLAHALAFIATPQPLSYAKGIEVLKAGNALELTNDCLVETRFYCPNVEVKAHLNYSNDDYAKEFKRLLTQSVRRRLRSHLGIGSMLSGGLDSVPMSIVASQLLKSEQKNLEAFSWSFNEHTQCDETVYSSPVCAQYEIKQHFVNCDKLNIQFDTTMPINPIVPLSTPYYLKHHELLRVAKRQEVGILLSGYAGDVLFSGTNNILYELLLKGRFIVFYNELYSRKRSYQSNWQFIKDYFIKPLNFFSRVEHFFIRKVDVCHLNDFANNKLLAECHWLKQEASHYPREKQFINIFNHTVGDTIGEAQYQDCAYSIQKRYPFRDRDLVEFMLRLPSEQLYFQAQTRPIVKRAFSLELTDTILNRNTKTGFHPFIQSRIDDDNQYERYLGKDNYLWSQYINECKFTAEQPFTTTMNLIKWASAYYEFWSQLCYDKKD